ncbi:hypothetical protein FHW96_004125 [Novosphingobium sp. SG751A]|uniref:hypothetical protein n=1 Tax=Novosphingobium sp. SG751A TaxID=2587000 RepID=UPI0020A6AA84|nr:hypothetical protein [Novosphingobium sp. SG751A]NOW47941.1 hypothetical protein [Novosphingobium sp. SG751A]
MNGTNANQNRTDVMNKLYRYVTAHRVGKWYPDLATAQRFAFKIGAGFMAEKSGQFSSYLGTRLEVLLPDGQVVASAA